ncbi:MAG TPA: type I phosphomannose isomerase catalytic subunit [Terracidiphilus sp.]|nr:type I phosphomannose isomerase catalytic subunit [Terracidiphilus sp.]
MSPISAKESSVFAPLVPFRVEPRYVARVWGYSDLHPWYDCTAHDQPIGEVWLTGDDCLVGSGPHAGKTLGSLFEQHAQALLGPAVTASGSASGSPLLIKVIFARQKLSVQVHPDDALARFAGQPRGKTECWYALAAEPGAQVALGLKPGVTLDQVRKGIHQGTLEQSLALLPVHAGDMFLVDAGTVHAIWPGSILLETQQNSDITYRIFDYGRPRELHIAQALQAIRTVTRAGKVAPLQLQDRTVLVNEDYFAVERIAVATSRSSSTLPGPGEAIPGLSYLFAAAGAGRITSAAFAPVELPTRGIVAIPASSPVFAIQDMGGLGLIRISPRWPA